MPNRHDARNDVEELEYESVAIGLLALDDEDDVEHSGIERSGKVKGKQSVARVHCSDRRSQEPNIQEERDKGGTSKDRCVICLEDLTDPTKLKCGHAFCKKCMDEYNKVCSHKCPTCGHIYGVLKGNQPDGRMTVRNADLTLPGHEGHGAIEITYKFPCGTQNESHPKPGMKYWGTTRKALLPDNPEGREVAHMLERAFNNRLLFTIGRSHTTDLDDAVVWNDVHHKTSVTGAYGYPDPGYLTRVKAELAAKGIFPESNKGK